MTHTYEFIFSVDTCKLLPQFGECIDSVNDAMRLFGFSEKMTVRSQCVTATLTGCRELTKDEINRAAAVIELGYRDKLPQYDIRFERAREV